MCECCVDANVKSTSKYAYMHTCTHTQRVIANQESKPVSALVMKAVCCIGQKVTSTTRWSSSHIDNKVSIWHPFPILSTCCTCGGVWSVTSLAGLRMYHGLIWTGFNYHASSTLTHNCRKCIPSDGFLEFEILQKHNKLTDMVDLESSGQMDWDYRELLMMCCKTWHIWKISTVM